MNFKHIIKQYYLPMYIFTVAIVDSSYMFWLLKVITIWLCTSSIKRKLFYM